MTSPFIRDDSSDGRSASHDANLLDGTDTDAQHGQSDVFNDAPDSSQADDIWSTHADADVFVFATDSTGDTVNSADDGLELTDINAYAGTQAYDDFLGGTNSSASTFVFDVGNDDMLTINTGGVSITLSTDDFIF